MSAFTGALTLTELDLDWRSWRLESPLTYEVGALGSGKIVTAPVGFVTDGASVPRVFWSALPAWGRYSRAAVIHDYLCTCINARDPHPLAPTRKVADGIFREAMKVCGVSALLRFVMWVAVRIEAIWSGKP
jgi:hypothetical protein